MNLTLQGYGPFSEPQVVRIGSGPTTITGPSGSGKTTTMHAISLALWGVMADGSDVAQKAINGERAAFRLDLDTAVIRVAVAPGPRWTRKWSSPEENEVSLSTQLDLARRLDAMDSTALLGSRRDVALTVLHPSRWVDLYNTERGRPLRDILATVLPPGDMAATVASLMAESNQEYVEGDPLHLQPMKPATAGRDVKVVPGALDRQREANTAETTAAANKATATRAVTDAETALAELTRNAPTDEALASARDTLAASLAWDKYDTALAAYNRELAHYESTVSRRAQYDAELAALGEAPVVDVDADAAANAALRAAENAEQDAANKVAEAERALSVAKAVEEAERRAAEQRRKDQEEAERQRVEAERRAQELIAAAEAAATERAAKAQQAREERERQQTAESATISLFPAATAQSAPVVEPVKPAAPKYDARSFNAGVDACIAWVVEYRENEECPDIRTVRDSLPFVKIKES